MKQDINCLIETLRLKKDEALFYGPAADRLKELQRANKNTLADLALTIERRDELLAEVIYLQKELAQAIAERTPHDYGLLKYEVEHLKQELTEAIRKRNKTVSDLIKQRDEAISEVEKVRVAWNESYTRERDNFCKEIKRAKAGCGNQQSMIQQEPSRLEIAAMLKAGWFANREGDFHSTSEKWWLEQADKLIAAAKEAK